MTGKERAGRAGRIVGALLGVHVGDALGAALEFSSWAQVRRRYPHGLAEITGGGPFGWPPGHATDDTDLTRAVLLAYLDAARTDGGRLGSGPADVVRAAAEYMLAWLDGDWPGREPGVPPRDVGGATRAGLEAYRQSRDPRSAGAGPGRAGNGSLMRCLPTGLAVAEPSRRISESIEISAITHDDERAVTACAAYNEIVAALIGGAGPATAVAAGLVTARALGSDQVAAAIETGRGLEPAVLAATGELPFPGQASGYVLDSLTLAVAAVTDPRPLAAVLVDIARLGHDADTNAAIAGGLLGARDGAAAIPARWTAVLQFGAEFAASGQALAR